PLDDKLRFEALAGQLKFFSAQNIIYDRYPERFLPEDWAATWKDAQAAIKAPDGGVPDLLRLVNHKDPRVRTLALAALFHREDPKLLPHLAALMPDRAKTFPALQAFAYPGFVRPPYPPPPLEDQTVGQVAEQFVRFWLQEANCQPKDF